MIEDGISVLRLYHCIVNILIKHTICILHAFLRILHDPFAPCGILLNTKSECPYSNKSLSVNRYIIKVRTCLPVFPTTVLSRTEPTVLNFRTYPVTRYHSGQELVILSADVCGALKGFSHPTFEFEQQGVINL